MVGWRVIYQNPETARKPRPLHLPETAPKEHQLESARERLFKALAACVSDQRVLQAMRRVPRELFVPPELAHAAYENSPLPIGESQTISQPLIVAIMAEALQLTGNEKVLEVGTGSGYNAAVLSHLAARVISVERRPALLESARRRLSALQISSVELHPSLETLGWPDHAPYDAILVTAGAPPGIPRSLLDQLGEGGRIVIPSGSRQRQELLRATRREGQVEVTRLGACGFVPLIGDQAWEDA